MALQCRLLHRANDYPASPRRSLCTRRLALNTVGTLVRTVKRHTPAALYPLARACYHHIVAPLHCAGVALADRVFRRTYQGRVLPPALLRFKVRGSPSGDDFARIGQSCAADIDSALAGCGVSLATCRAILDFGCGCGGVLMWLYDRVPAAAMTGTDIDVQAIDWCRAHLPIAQFDVNGALPPLPYRDASFDLVYAISVFTHLDETYQHRWLAELKRIIEPGGVCLLTLHGPDSWSEMTDADRTTLASDGFLFVTTHATRQLFPAWYQTAFHTRTYVEATFSKYFDILAFTPRGMVGHQDVVVLRRPNAVT